LARDRGVVLGREGTGQTSSRDDRLHDDVRPSAASAEIHAVTFVALFRTCDEKEKERE
jgi:hypothetical protein